MIVHPPETNIPSSVQFELNHLDGSFFLTGSRYFGHADTYSDWNFYVQDSREIEQVLCKSGWVKATHNSLNVTHVYHKKFNNFQVQGKIIGHSATVELVINLLDKHRANDWIKKMCPIANFNNAIMWERAYAHIMKNALEPEQREIDSQFSWGGEIIPYWKGYDNNRIISPTNPTVAASGLLYGYNTEYDIKHFEKYLTGRQLINQDYKPMWEVAEDKNGTISMTVLHDPIPVETIKFKPAVRPEVSYEPVKKILTCQYCEGTPAHRYISRLNRPDRIACKECLLEEIEWTMDNLDPNAKSLLKRLTGSNV